jgi:Arc/MetJ family transcription regulator
LKRYRFLNNIIIAADYTRRWNMSRTVINLEDDVLKKALNLTGMKKKVDVVNLAMRKLVEQKEIEKILDLKGKIKWEGNLDEMRAGRRGSR